MHPACNNNKLCFWLVICWPAVLTQKSDVMCMAPAGNGVIVHSSDKVGLVVADRSTVPVNGGNITLSFGAYPDELPGRVRFLHPLHNFAIISYDPFGLSQQVPLKLDKHSIFLP